MRSILMSSAVAAAFGISLATIAIEQAHAEFKPIGSYSGSALRRACAGAGGSYGSNSVGEHWCEKAGILIDCNNRNKCQGGTARAGGGSNSGTGGTAGTKAAAYLGPATRASGQGTRPVTGLAPGMGRHHR
jgi:hypothetical protein